jgi:hypothetical protein
VNYRLINLTILFCFVISSCQGPSLGFRGPADIGAEPSGCDVHTVKLLSSINRGKPKNVDWAGVTQALQQGVVSKEGGEFENALARVYDSLDEEGRTLLEKRLLGLDGFQRKKLRWKVKRRSEEQEVSDVIDSLYRVSYAKVGFLSVYRFSKKRFTKASVEAYTDFILIKHALLGDDFYKVGLSSIPAVVGKKTLQLFSFLLPFELGRVGVKYNRIHLKILKSKGHKGLYTYLKHTHGNIKALKYWLVHLTNIKLIGAIGLLAFIGPELYESHGFWTDLLKVELDEDANLEDLEQVVLDKDLTPEELKDSLVSELEKSGSGEALKLKELLISLED